LKNNLSVQAALISESISFNTAESLDGLCRHLKEKTGTRVTLIDMAGKVLGDSDNDSSQMDNHADRVEIQQALISGTGWSVRYSDTLRHDLLYTAHKIMQGEQPVGFIRLAVLLEDVNKSVNALRFKINLVVIMIFLLSGLVLVWQTERIRRFVHQVTDYAGSLTHGFFKKRLHLEGAGEISELAAI